MRLATVVLVVSTLGCSRVPLGSAGAPVTRGIAVAPTPSRLGPNAYTIHLLPSGASQPALVAPGTDSGVVADRTTGTLRVVFRDGNKLEYQLTIFNEDRRSFTAGYVYRGTAEPDHLVATLFTGELLSSRYIQLRGTGRVVKAAHGTALLEQFRESPNEFVVRIDGRTRSSAVLLGTLQQ